MLIEILSFFAIAAALATLVCLLRGAPAWFWPVGVPGALLVLAASGLGTALISGDPLAGRVLGVAGLVIWVAAWVTLRRWQPMAVLMFAMLVMAALSYIVYASALTVVQSSGAVFLLASSLLLVLETVGLVLSLSYAFEILDVMGRRGSPAPPPPVGPPPMVALQVPTYSEPVEIVRSTLEALARLEYPNYMVQVVDNNTPDPSLWRPLQQLCEQLGPRFEFIHLENWPGFKAGALNEATRRLPREVEVVGVVDADYIVHPGWLAGTAPHFGDPHVAFVQAAQHYRDWEDDPYLRGLFYSYRYFFDVSMPARAHRNAIIFCGTMGLIRRASSRRWAAGIRSASPRTPSAACGYWPAAGPGRRLRPPPVGRGNDAAQLRRTQEAALPLGPGGHSDPPQALARDGAVAAPPPPPHRRSARPLPARLGAVVRRPAHRPLHPDPGRHRRRRGRPPHSPCGRWWARCWWSRSSVPAHRAAARDVGPAPDDRLRLGGRASGAPGLVCALLGGVAGLHPRVDAGAAPRSCAPPR